MIFKWKYNYHFCTSLISAVEQFKNFYKTKKKKLKINTKLKHKTQVINLKESNKKPNSSKQPKKQIV